LGADGFRRTKANFSEAGSSSLGLRPLKAGGAKHVPVRGGVSA
jgi:hypothetical protein